jgi:hypothetical protein
MNYNIDLIELVSDLSPIQQQLGFEKEDDKIVLRAKEESTKIAYKLIAPVDYFDYPGQSLRFFEYKRFKSFFDIFNYSTRKDETSTPILDANLSDRGEVVDLIIKSTKGKQQFTYRTAIEGAIENPEFNNIVLPSVDAELILSQQQIDHLQKMINLIQDKGEKSGIRFQFEGSTMKVSFINMTTSDSYEIEYDLINAVKESFEFVTDKEGLTLLPSADYKFNICARGLMEIHMNRDDAINLNLYISKQKRSGYRG